MLGLGPIAFAAPWILGALIVLPVLWWLLRLTPPSPRIVQFPAIRLLRDLVAREETPARTPLWLLIMRMVLAALVILALAQPLLNPRAGLPGSGPIILVVDNGWGAARDWQARQRTMADLVDQAERNGRDLIVVATAPSASGEKPQPSTLLRPADARRLTQSLAPRPWPTDRASVLEALRGLQVAGSAHTVWLSDGLADAAALPLAQRLQQLGGAEVLMNGADRLPNLLLPPSVEGNDLVARVRRADTTLPSPVTIRATAADGRLLARQEATFAPGSDSLEVPLSLPVELRNEVTRLAIEGEATAGATVLLDERWRRRPVGLVSGRPEGENQPLLSDLYYLERALAPFSEIRRGSVLDLMGRDLSVLILADIGALTETEAQAVESWVERGGVLVRFAGPRLAQHTDQLVPVRLRLGDRTLGGALSWSEPARLAPFPPASPFAGLPVPPDVVVDRQVLAEPSIDLAEKTWARLADGTPLVTAEEREEGRIVLVHTTANSDWSNLALSGLFVDMLRRVTALSEGVSGDVQAATFAPIEVLDGLGQLIPPPATVFPIAGDAFRPETLGPRHPPGFYGTEEARRALNLTSLVTAVEPLRRLPAGVAQGTYAARGEIDLKPWLLGAAMALAIIDLFVALVLRGLLGNIRFGRRRRAAAAASAVLLAAGLLAAGPGPARASDEFAVKASGETYLAYVVTGDRVVDDTTRAGLEGLSEILNRRTAVETAGAMAVNLEQDELAFFPLIYWAISPSQPDLSDSARLRLNEFLRNGGTILFDTRDRQYGPGSALTGGGPGAQRLRQLVDGLDVPALAPVPPEHVLTKAFYLLQDFPGRFGGGDVWVEAQEGRHNDGVSSVIIGSADWAGAWAVDEAGRPLNAVVPGGERQREMAYRFGVNLMMYALTGNYKADQVHVPAILERLGQ
ncbi:DUF4159 domain-containing protein [Skermanella mucosa]|uniref:DUF4159 domain-containing protein n=1 Tax=Skermanella mucosa TaxID=1789672 RepID=UPI00192AFA11|nr:DUF4159 domain-containing protein [Skermanella mucosa]UEM22003.1 DUF4159 domain-containing protein [Skermanella mucosa]